MTILYADDDHDDRELMSEALNEVDPSITCVTVKDGQMMMEVLQDETPLPDYIFLDVNMPVKDGKQSLVELKKDERLRDIPVIICSTTADKKEIDELYDLGASSFIHKPNNFTDLCSTLNIFVKLVQG